VRSALLLKGFICVTIFVNAQTIDNAFTITTSNNELYYAGDYISFEGVIDSFEQPNTNDFIESQIIDKDGQALVKGIFIVKNGRFSGTLSIPKNTLTGGYYLVSNFIHNQPLKDQFKKELITIINFERKFPYDRVDKNTKPQPIHHLFYDSLFVINNINESKFEILNHFEKPIKVIINSKSQKKEWRADDRNIFNDEQTLSQKPGVEKDLLGKVDIANSLITVSVVGNSTNIYYTKTNGLGEFSIPEFITTGSNIIYIQSEQRDLLNIKALTGPFIQPITIIENLNPEPIDFKIAADTIAIKALLAEKINNSPADSEKTLTDRSNFSDQFIYNTSDYINFQSTFDFLKNVVKLKKLKLAKNDTSFYLLNQVTKKYQKGEPLLVIDGILQKNFSKAYSVPLNSIRAVDISLNDKGLNPLRIKMHSLKLSLLILVKKKLYSYRKKNQN
jgi:hypothetical protein